MTSNETTADSIRRPVCCLNDSDLADIRIWAADLDFLAMLLAEESEYCPPGHSRRLLVLVGEMTKLGSLIWESVDWWRKQGREGPVEKDDWGLSSYFDIPTADSDSDPIDTGTVVVPTASLDTPSAEGA